MNTSFIQLLKAKTLEWDHKQSGSSDLASDPDYLRGYSSDEIAEVVEGQGVDFIPMVYNQFLSEMGHYSSLTLKRAYILEFERLLTMKRHFIILTHETQSCSKNYQPPNDIFVFACSYEDYWFFRTEEKNDDPPVYFYHECFRDALQVAPHLSDWLLVQAFYPPRRWIDDHLLDEMMTLWRHE